MIAELVILLAFLTQPFAIEGNSSDRIHRSRVKLPAVRRQEPGPADHLAGPHGLHDCLARNRARPDFDMAGLDQVEGLGGLAFTGKILAGRSREWPRSGGQQHKMAVPQTAEKLMA